MTSHLDWSDAYCCRGIKARCLALIDDVHERGEPITITKRGRVVARLVSAGEADERPWTRVRGMAHWQGDPFAPAVGEHDVDALA